MMKKLLIFIALIIVLPALATTKLQEKYDKFTDTTSICTDYLAKEKPEESK